MEEIPNFSNGEKRSEDDSRGYDKIKIKSSGRVIKRKKKRKANENAKVLSRNEILAMINKIPDGKANFSDKGMMYRALISLLYLTGARINEVLTIKKSQFEFTQDQKTGIKYMIVSNIPTLKRKGKHLRSQFMRKDFEHDFIVHVKKWIDELATEDALLFPISDSRAYQIVLKYTEMYPHYFRHVRNIDLVRHYGFNSYWLQRWNGWKKISSSEAYVHLVAQDLKEKILGIDRQVG